MGILLECSRDVLSTTLPPAQLKSPVIQPPAKAGDGKQKIVTTYAIIERIENPLHQSPVSPPISPLVNQESLAVPISLVTTPTVEKHTEQVQKDEDVITPALSKPVAPLSSRNHSIPKPMPPIPYITCSQHVPDKDSVPGPKAKNNPKVSLPERTAAHTQPRTHAEVGPSHTGPNPQRQQQQPGRGPRILSGFRRLVRIRGRGRGRGDDEGDEGDEEIPPSEGDRKPKRVELRRIPGGVLSNDGLPMRDSLWGNNDQEMDDTITPTLVQLPWHIRMINEKDDLNTIAVHLASFRRNLKDCGVDFAVNHRPLCFIDDHDRDGKWLKYTDSDKRNGHHLHNLYFHVGEQNWATLCVTREHHLTGSVWHYWALAVIAAPRQSPVQTRHDAGMHLLMYDSKPAPEPRYQRHRDYFVNYLSGEQEALLMAFLEKFRVLTFAINRDQIPVQGEYDPLRFTMWWIWAVARYGGRDYLREEHDGEDLDDPRWRLANSRHMDLTPNRLRTIEARLRGTNIRRMWS